MELTAHAFALIDSYVFGFALSENALPIHGPDSVADTAASMMHFFDTEAYPALLEFTMEHIMRPDYDFGEEFDYGLELILDGLARALANNGAPPARRPRPPSKPARARSGTLNALAPGPKNSTNLPTTFALRSSSVTLSTRSVAVTPF